MVRTRKILVLLACLCQPGASYAHHDANLPQAVPPLELAAPDGAVHSLHAYKGQVVLLDFWATWCHMCRELMPVYQTMYEQYRSQGLVIVGIAQDEDPAVVRAWLAEHGVSFPILLDPTMRAAADFTVIKLPTAILVNRQGQPVQRFSGDDRSMKQDMESAILKLLNSPAPE